MSGRKSRFGALAGALSARKGKAEAPPAKRLGKSKDKANYVQTTVYLSRTVHKDVQVELAKQEQEYSQLVEDLLRDWLSQR